MNKKVKVLLVSTMLLLASCTNNNVISSSVDSASVEASSSETSVSESSSEESVSQASVNPFEGRVNLLGEHITSYIMGDNPISSYEGMADDKQVPYVINFENAYTNATFSLSIKDNNYENTSYSWSENSLSSIKITNLMANKTYSWSVKVDDIEKESGSFTTMACAPRWMNIDGINNVRDLGGWNGTNGEIAQGLIYRGSEMNKHYTITEEGIATMKNEMKIKTVIDLRTNAEADNITVSPLGEDVNYIHLDKFAGYMAVTTKDEQIPYYTTIFKTLANSDSYPIYFHCYQGADRTGTIACMIEGLMGVSTEDRLKDYNFTTFSSGDDCYRDGESTKRQYSYIQKNIQLKYPADSFELSMDRYLKERLGLSEDEVSSIKNNLLGNSTLTRGMISSIISEN